MAVIVDLTSSPPSPTADVANAPNGVGNDGDDARASRAKRRGSSSSKPQSQTQNNIQTSTSTAGESSNGITAPTTNGFSNEGPASPVTATSRSEPAQRRSSRRLSERNASYAANAANVVAVANANANTNGKIIENSALSAKSENLQSSGSSKIKANGNAKSNNGRADNVNSGFPDYLTYNDASGQPIYTEDPPTGFDERVRLPMLDILKNWIAGNEDPSVKDVNFLEIYPQDSDFMSEAKLLWDEVRGDVWLAKRVLEDKNKLCQLFRYVFEERMLYPRDTVTKEFYRTGGNIRLMSKSFQQKEIKELEKRHGLSEEEAEEGLVDMELVQHNEEERGKEKEQQDPLRMTKLKEELDKVEEKSISSQTAMEADAMEVDNEDAPVPSLNGSVTSNPDTKSKHPSRPPSPLTSPPINGLTESALMPPPPSSTASVPTPTPLSTLSHSPVHSEPNSVAKSSRSNSPFPSAPAPDASTSALALDVPLVSQPLSQKPKSTAEKKARVRSPSPDAAPPVKRAPMQTIRLEISLGGPEKYAVDVRTLARETGQREPTPEPEAVKRDTSESEGEGAGAGAGAESGTDKKGKGKGGKRRHRESEYYDLDDPFIDDSELALDERTFFAQTKQQGFYVSSGEVALLKDRSSQRGKAPKSGIGRGSTPPSGAGDGGSPMKKPKSKKMIPMIIPLAGVQVVSDAAETIPLPSQSQQQHVNGSGANSPTDPFGPSAASQLRSPTERDDSVSAATINGSREVPIMLLDGEDASTSSTGHKRKAGDALTGGKKKRKTVEIEMFHPDLQSELRELKGASNRESWEVRGKFPPSLKPLLARVALKAIACGEYGDAFFTLMPRIFPYNKYTMSKLIKRTVYADHQKVLAARQDELLEELAKEAQEGFTRAREEHERAVTGWEKRQVEKSGKSAEGTPVPGTTPAAGAAPLPPISTGGMDSGGEEANGAVGGKEGGHVRGDAPPPQRFRLTERLRNIIWELVVLSNESVRIENEKNSLENSTVQVSEQGTRKGLYQRIVAAFPDGWMTSGQISREVSVMKKRFEAQQAEEGAAN